MSGANCSSAPLAMPPLPEPPMVTGPEMPTSPRSDSPFLPPVPRFAPLPPAPLPSPFEAPLGEAEPAPDPVPGPAPEPALGFEPGAGGPTAKSPHRLPGGRAKSAAGSEGSKPTTTRSAASASGPERGPREMGDEGAGKKLSVELAITRNGSREFVSEIVGLVISAFEWSTAFGREYCSASGNFGFSGALRATTFGNGCSVLIFNSGGAAD